MFTVCARVVIRLKRSLQDVSNEVCYQFMVSLILPVFATAFTGFFHCPGKNPTLLYPTPVAKFLFKKENDNMCELKGGVQ